MILLGKVTGLASLTATTRLCSAWWPGGLVDLLGHLLAFFLQEVTQAAFDGGFDFGTETLLLAA